MEHKDFETVKHQLLMILLWWIPLSKFVNQHNIKGKTDNLSVDLVMFGNQYGSSVVTTNRASGEVLVTRENMCVMGLEHYMSFLSILLCT